MSIRIVQVQKKQLPLVVGLNNQAIPNVNLVDEPKLKWFYRMAPYFRVAVLNDKLAGFLIAIPDSVAYDSIYFQWFTQRYSDFLYIDRIVVADWAQRRGVGLALYRDVELFAASMQTDLTTDVYSMPANDVSLAFHHRCGFRLIGSQDVENGTKTVAKFLKQPVQGGPLL